MIDRDICPSFFSDQPKLETMRAGFGRGLVKAGARDERIVALTADLADSIHMGEFRDKFAERFVEVGVAEQNLVTVASGLARAGKIPFAGSYSAFNPGRNWEQIRTTICLNDLPVKIVGSHAGLTVGPDGATHQMLEDIALMRVLPNMTVIAPGDSLEAEKATLKLAELNSPGYLRLSRNSTAIFTNQDDDFDIGKAYRFWSGGDVTIVATGAMSQVALEVASKLQDSGVSPDVLHLPTIKPLDNSAIIESVEKTGRVVSLEDGQVAGGLGSAVAELLSSELPVPILRLGVNDKFGQSGEAGELLEYYELDAKSVTEKIRKFVQKTPPYRRGF
ncbi:transketolase [Candidatus Saccharibacteria bacterium]|nr:MAG: transketolase [Candidatus Saccharibacteria bacterium]